MGYDLYGGLWRYGERDGCTQVNFQLNHTVPHFFSIYNLDQLEDTFLLVVELCSSRKRLLKPRLGDDVLQCSIYFTYTTGRLPKALARDSREPYVKDLVPMFRNQIVEIDHLNLMLLEQFEFGRRCQGELDRSEGSGP